MYIPNSRNGYGISHTCFLFGGWITDFFIQNWWNMSFGNFLGICKNLYFFTRSFVFAKLLLKSIYKLLLKLHVLHTFCLSFIFWDQLPIRSNRHFFFKVYGETKSFIKKKFSRKFKWIMFNQYLHKISVILREKSKHLWVISGIFTKKVTKLTYTI